MTGWVTSYSASILQRDSREHPICSSQAAHHEQASYNLHFSFDNKFPTKPMKSLLALNEQLTDLINQVLPAAVMIKGYSRDLSSGSQGSGWVYASNLVVTNHHVVEGMAEPFIVQPVGRCPLNGVLVGCDPANDIAVLKVENLDSQHLTLEDKPPMLGELCIAIGAPHSYRESASLGIISGLSRQLRNPDGLVIEEMLQTDASVNPGNSGGPLVNIHGRVLGMNTCGPAETVNFAIPSETIASVIPELVEHGSIQRGSIGISISSNVRTETGELEQWVTVRKVLSDASPFKQGDIILNINGKEIKRRVDVIRALDRQVIDKSIKVVISRNEQQQTIEVTPWRRQ